MNDNSAPAQGGGGILDIAGTLELNGSQVNDNTAATGGGIASGNGNGGGPNSVLVLNGSQVNDNTATSALGGPGGGGIGNAGTAAITLSEVNGNSASSLGGGIAEASDGETGPPGPGNSLTLSLSLVTGNSSAAGGGIYAIAGSPVTLRLTLIAKNSPDNCEPLGSIVGCAG